MILKPSPADVQDLYLGSLKALGIDPAAHDVRFEEDNWESPTLGAWGIGWQVLLDGQEITQFTYFQQAGGIDLAPISAEITYGLERIGMYLQDVDDVYELRWSKDVLYGEVRKEEEYQLSRYSFEEADPELYRLLFEKSLAEGWRILEAAGRPAQPRRLRLGAEGFPLLQRPRRAGRHLGEPAGGHDPEHPQAGLRGGRGLRGRDDARRSAGGGRPWLRRAEFLLEIGLRGDAGALAAGADRAAPRSLRRGRRPRAALVRATSRRSPPRGGSCSGPRSKRARPTARRASSAPP